MTDGVRQDKFAVERSEAGSTCPFTRTDRKGTDIKNVCTFLA